MTTKREQATLVGIPEDELFLAKLIQNAKARDLRSCRFATFRDKSRRVLVPNLNLPFEVAYCCASGAANLAEDTRKLMQEGFVSRGDLMIGNDGHGWTGARVIGRAFYHAAQ